MLFPQILYKANYEVLRMLLLCIEKTPKIVCYIPCAAIHTWKEGTMNKYLKDRQKLPPLWMDLLALFLKIAALAVVFLLLFTFVFGLYRNQDGDMFPSVRDGDLVVFYRLDSDYHASDCLVLDYQGKRSVRRVIATAGDTVDITEEGLSINGTLQYEPNIYENTFRYESGPDFPVTLQEGEVFVMGDARDNATDSRVYGPVRVKDVLGKVMMVIRRREF